ncbi:hypothetical protein CsSME_00032433 [Camellia sinensis var. sinensis]
MQKLPHVHARATRPLRLDRTESGIVIRGSWVVDRGSWTLDLGLLKWIECGGWTWPTHLNLFGPSQMYGLQEYVHET